MQFAFMLGLYFDEPMVAEFFLAHCHDTGDQANKWSNLRLWKSMPDAEDDYDTDNVELYEEITLEENRREEYTVQIEAETTRFSDSKDIEIEMNGGIDGQR